MEEEEQEEEEEERTHAVKCLRYASIFGCPAASSSCMPATMWVAYSPLSSGSSPGSSLLRPKRGSLAMLMLGP